MKKRISGTLVFFFTIAAFLAVYPPLAKETKIKTIRDQATDMEFVWVEGGCYEMGDTFGDGYSEEKSVHAVCLDGFYLGKHEVTQGHWLKIMGSNPSRFARGDRYPVENVNWLIAQEFIKKINRGGMAKYRLPTEAEWEYAARSRGNKVKYATSSGEISAELANYQNDGGAKPVGSYPPNPLGLYDMSGNVWEWVEDVFHPQAYEQHPPKNPVYRGKGDNRVIRGGGFYPIGDLTRSTLRGYRTASGSYSYVGFRLVKIK